MSILRFFAMAALSCSLAIAVPNVAIAAENAKIFKAKKVPKQPIEDRALLWVRMAKHSDHRRGSKIKPGLGMLFGSVKVEKTDERIPLKKPIWPQIQLAMFDTDANEFLGMGPSEKKLGVTQTRPVYIGPKRFVHEDENFRHYLVAVSAGTYVIGGTSSTCFCWGSKTFTVKAGEVVNMGVYYVATENGLSYWPEFAELNTAEDLYNRGLITDTMKLALPSDTDSAPDVLGHLPMVQAEYVDVTNFGNHFGRLVNRMVPDDWEGGAQIMFDKPIEAAAENEPEPPATENAVDAELVFPTAQRIATEPAGNVESEPR